MIFVTVGSTHFDNLIREVDRLISAGVIQDDVFAQIGAGRYIPRHARWTRYLDSLHETEEQADLVICHGGVGSVFELLNMDKDFIAVANPDLPDGHQAELLGTLAAEGWCTCCLNLSELEQSLVTPRRRKPYPRNPQLPHHIWSLVVGGAPQRIPHDEPLACSVRQP